MQTDMYHLRLSADESRVIKAQAERCGISGNALAVALLKAAIEAVKDHRGRLIPPKFQLGDEILSAARLNEPPPTSYAKRK